MHLLILVVMAWQGTHRLGWLLAHQSLRHPSRVRATEIARQVLKVAAPTFLVVATLQVDHILLANEDGVGMYGVPLSLMEVLRSVRYPSLQVPSKKHQRHKEHGHPNSNIGSAFLVAIRRRCQVISSRIQECKMGELRVLGSQISTRFRTSCNNDLNPVPLKQQYVFKDNTRPLEPTKIPCRHGIHMENSSCCRYNHRLKQYLGSTLSAMN
jgi:hypothetical protein